MAHFIPGTPPASVSVSCQNEWRVVLAQEDLHRPLLDPFPSPSLA